MDTNACVCLWPQSPTAAVTGQCVGRVRGWCRCPWRPTPPTKCRSRWCLCSRDTCPSPRSKCSSTCPTLQLWPSSPTLVRPLTQTYNSSAPLDLLFSIYTYSILYTYCSIAYSLYDRLYAILILIIIILDCWKFHLKSIVVVDKAKMLKTFSVSRSLLGQTVYIFLYAFLYVPCMYDCA